MTSLLFFFQGKRAVLLIGNTKMTQWTEIMHPGTYVFYSRLRQSDKNCLQSWTERDPFDWNMFSPYQLVFDTSLFCGLWAIAVNIMFYACRGLLEFATYSNRMWLLKTHQGSEEQELTRFPWADIQYFPPRRCWFRSCMWSEQFCLPRSHCRCASSQPKLPAQDRRFLSRWSGKQVGTILVLTFCPGDNGKRKEYKDKQLTRKEKWNGKCTFWRNKILHKRLGEF